MIAEVAGGSALAVSQRGRRCSHIALSSAACYHSGKPVSNFTLVMQGASVILVFNYEMTLLIRSDIILVQIESEKRKRPR